MKGSKALLTWLMVCGVALQAIAAAIWPAPLVAQGPLPDKFLFSIGAQAPVGQFNCAAGVAVAPDGSVYVADYHNCRIQHFGAAGTFLNTWGSCGSEEGKFSHPGDIAVAPDGTVYVADTYNHRIQRFSATGAFLGKWGSQGSGDGQFNWPEGVAVAPNGTVYVADTSNHRIQRFSATGAFLGKWGSFGSGDGQFDWPRGVAVAPDGTVYVADTSNHRIQRFSATGALLGKWGSQGSGDGQFALPEGVAVAPDGTVYVADMGNHRIQRFSAAGAFLGKWGSFGSGDGQFQWPDDVAVAPNGTVYVADTYNHRIQAFGTAYPDTWRGEYHNNPYLTGAPVLIRQDASIHFDWGAGSPDPSLPADRFSARWYRYVWFAGGTYQFVLYADDGVRFWVDDQLLVDSWTPQAARFQRNVFLGAGYHRILVEYYEEGVIAEMRLDWTPVGVRLPIVMKQRVGLPEPCQEPANNSPAGACGPLVSGQEYTDYIDSAADSEDWVYFVSSRPHTVEVWLTGICDSCDYNLYLVDEGMRLLGYSGNLGNASEHILTEVLPAGRYYVRVRRAAGWSATVPYVLRVVFE